jgi:hypothetical protein
MGKESLRGLQKRSKCTACRMFPRSLLPSELPMTSWGGLLHPRTETKQSTNHLYFDLVPWIPKTRTTTHSNFDKLDTLTHEWCTYLASTPSWEFFLSRYMVVSLSLGNVHIATSVSRTFCGTCDSADDGPSSR